MKKKGQKKKTTENFHRKWNFDGDRLFSPRRHLLSFYFPSWNFGKKKKKPIQVWPTFCWSTADDVALGQFRRQRSVTRWENVVVAVRFVFVLFFWVSCFVFFCVLPLWNVSSCLCFVVVSVHFLHRVLIDIQLDCIDFDRD